MLAIDAVLVGGVAVGLEGRDEGLEAGSEDNEVAGTGSGDVGVRVAGGNEDCSAGTGGLGAVGVMEGQLAFKDVPGFVVGVVDVERGGAAAAPFVDGERVAAGGERHLIIIAVLTGARRAGYIHCALKWRSSVTAWIVGKQKVGARSPSGRNPALQRCGKADAGRPPVRLLYGNATHCPVGW